MNLAVGILRRSAKVGLLLGAIAALIDGSTSTGRAQPNLNLEFRALASADDTKDKPAIDAWKAAFADEKNKGKLEQAAAEGKPPVLIVPKEDGDKKTDPGRYEFVPVTDSELSLIGINLASSFKKDAEIRELIEKARKNKQPVVITGKNVVLYSWGNEPGSYALLARPVSDEAALSGREVERATRVVDANNRHGVQVKLTKKGTEQFETFSKQHQKHFLVIYARGQMVFAARLAEPITTGELEITGRLDADRARNIADAIRSCIVPKEKEKGTEKAKEK